MPQTTKAAAPFAPAPTSSARRTVSAAGANTAARILVVEDNPVNQKVLQHLMARLRFGCDVANDGQQAVAMVPGKPYDLVLIDWQMPVMDGMEATRPIRAMGGKYTGLPIIAVTANAMEGDRERCSAADLPSRKTLSVFFWR